MPWDEPRLRNALDRWGALPPGPERDRLARELVVALRALSPEAARRLTADVYRAFRARTMLEGPTQHETAGE